MNNGPLRDDSRFAARQVPAQDTFAPRPSPPLLLLRQPLRNPPRAGKRNVQLGGRAWRDINAMAAWPRPTPAEMIDHRIINPKPGRLGLRDHPKQRIFRKTTV